ncbi:MAG TPA: SIMPL domain-containing protein [Bryobacteraceae bacterium]|nr:SIMPL domain-containing protein [Bryobacteraceae bacterium]
MICRTILSGVAGAAMLFATPAVVESEPTLISVASTGKAVAKPDLAVVFLSARSSAPLAADALEQNKKKVQEMSARLTAMGYKDGQVRWSGHRFSPAGQGMYYPGGQRPTGFDVYNNLFVLIEGTELKNLNDFNAKVSTLLDELSKLGASPNMMPISSMSMGGASVVAFSLKDAAAAEREAYQQAMDRARPIAEDIAKRMKVQITGIASVNSTSMGRMVVGGPPNPLDELPYEYISSSIDEVPVRVRLDVRFSYK